ncbi:hypothetical protein U9M48_032091 [Paspalum notatum var. saurae]|uniref:Uncharacterized protein n=1 Tax=Paspalum notatum var. saurae TaxID=547442 RepID=A0AAQ3U4D9_PASNO
MWGRSACQRGHALGLYCAETVRGDRFMIEATPRVVRVGMLSYLMRGGVTTTQNSYFRFSPMTGQPDVLEGYRDLILPDLRRVRRLAREAVRRRMSMPAYLH